MTHLVWFRNDLRLEDNPALYHACQQGRSEGRAVRAIYCATPQQWRRHCEAPAKLALRSDALRQLQVDLSGLGIELEVLQAPLFADLAGEIARYCQRLEVRGLWFNRELFLDEQGRDKAVVAALKTAGVPCHSFCADMLLPRQLLNKQGGYYKVFTPWYRAWLQQLQQHWEAPLPAPGPVANPVAVVSAVTPLPGAGSYRSDIWPGRESAAQALLATFAHKLQPYSAGRDYPAVNATSRLSVYLASGMISVRRCLQWIEQTAFEQGWDWRESAWLRELGWREFYRYLMVCFPSLGKGKPFKTQADEPSWRFNQPEITAWQQGQTGFPIIDGAMRQLRQTGWMHNRLRMLTASFFCKLMLHDWRLGEQFFMENLLDGDFASNNGGWQWSSSTGCDASPWFRIFNPTTQSQKFDAKGEFIRKMVPELAFLDDRSIHWPSQKQRDELGYPQPILDYSAARKRALDCMK